MVRRDYVVNRSRLREVNLRGLLRSNGRDEHQVPGLANGLYGVLGECRQTKVYVSKKIYRVGRAAPGSASPFECFGTMQVLHRGLTRHGGGLIEVASGNISGGLKLAGRVG